MSQSSVDLVLESVETDGLRFAGHAGGFTVTIDSGVGAVAPTPPQLVLLALGACTGMDVISILRKQRQRVTGYTVVLHGERRDEHPRRYTAIEIVHRLRGHALDDAGVGRAIELSDTKYCSVMAMLADGAAIRSRFELLPA